MVLRLGDALQLPLCETNRLLNEAGFSAQYQARDWTSEEMAPIRGAVSHTLQRHEPFPALAIDRLWVIVEANQSAASLFGHFGLGNGGSLLDLMQRPVLPDIVENWSQVAHHTAQRLRTENTALGGVRELETALDYLGKFEPPQGVPPEPVIPIVLRLPGVRLSLFATIAHFGTPEDVALEEIKLELYFPMDEETRAFFGNGPT